MTNREQRAWAGLGLTVASLITLAAGGLTFPDTPNRSVWVIVFGLVLLAAAGLLTDYAPVSDGGRDE